MFTLGVQKVCPARSALFMARASVAMVAPMACHSVALKACAVVQT